MAVDSSEEPPAAAPTVHMSDKEPPLIPPPPTDDIDIDDDDDINEQRTCLICNLPNASLLVCVEQGCPSAFHDNCLRGFATYDALGNFCCLFCAYTRAIAESLQAKTNVLLAKTLLSDFINNKMPAVQTLPQKRKATDDNTEEPKDPLCSTNGSSPVLNATANNEDNEGGNQNQTIPPTTHQAPIQNDPIVHGSETTDPRGVTASLPNPSMNFSSPIPTSARRKKMRWTLKEEDMLKKGVHKFSTQTKKNIPWRKILEFGCRIFDGTRTPEDLKDKWKNNLAKRSKRDGDG